MKVFQFNEIFEAYEHARFCAASRWNGRERWQRVRPTDD